MDGSRALCDQVLVVGSAVVHIVERRHEVERHAAELPLEHADTVPGMVRFALRCRAPQIVPFMAQRLGDAHDLEMERSEEHTSELQSRSDLVCRLLLEKKKTSI